MKSKEIKELPNKTNADLKKMLRELHLDIAKTRLDLKLGRSKNTAVLKEMKRDIARVMTVMNLQEKGEQVSK
ncbi:MAG TPA: 50S ribosomal protein L29 [Candidatus Levybacteria bacterium]|nr:50S ribosomal protein L29 [Candidatus Levybacteria bacterium]